MERAGRFRVIAYDKASYQLQRYHGEGGTISRRRDEHTYIPLQRYHGEGGTKKTLPERYGLDSCNATMERAGQRIGDRDMAQKKVATLPWRGRDPFVRGT